jgi:hypothetical protein
MLADADGKPKVGASAKTLGVRVSPDSKPDLPVDGEGCVLPATGGMSVAPSWRQLPPWRIPKRLQAVAGEAIGSDALICWRIGEGAFVRGPVADKLVLCPDEGEAPVHGVVEPSTRMALDQYQGALFATREQWVRDEE